MLWSWVPGPHCVTWQRLAPDRPECIPVLRATNRLSDARTYLTPETNRGKKWLVWVCGQWFGAEAVQQIKDALKAEPNISRRVLSRQVCEWVDWYDRLGQPREMGARKALAELERRGVIELPAAKRIANFNRDARKAKMGSAIEVAPVDGACQ
jgi:hypothetical protein